MISLEQIHQKVTAEMPDAVVEWVDNPGPSSQHSLRVSTEDVITVARFLRDDPALRFDYCSNVTGVDRLDTTIEETVATTKEVDGEEKTVKTKVARAVPGYLEAVYHLYSTIHQHGPAIIRMRTANRDSDVRIPSLTPIWKSAEFQEREIYDLYGIEFTGHPDLRRLLMWDSFVGHPMRKDFVQADDETNVFTAIRETDPS